MPDRPYIPGDETRIMTIQRTPVILGSEDDVLEAEAFIAGRR